MDLITSREGVEGGGGGQIPQEDRAVLTGRGAEGSIGEMVMVDTYPVWPRWSALRVQVSRSQT